MTGSGLDQDWTRRAGSARAFGDAADRCSWGAPARGSLGEGGPPRSKRDGPTSGPKTPSGGGWPQKAQRVEGVAEVGVAPIGAADAIGGASRGEGFKPTPRGLTGPIASKAEAPRFEPCPKGSSLKMRGVYGRHAQLRSPRERLVPFVASPAWRVRSAPGGWPRAKQTDPRPPPAPWRNRACCGSPPSSRGPAPWRQSCCP